MNYINFFKSCKVSLFENVSTFNLLDISAFEGISFLAAAVVTSGSFVGADAGTTVVDSTFFVSASLVTGCVDLACLFPQPIMVNNITTTIVAVIIFLNIFISPIYL